MNKTIISTFVVFILLFSVVFATAPTFYGNSQQTSQYYSVFFDEEGQAAVAAKLIIQNTGKEPIRAVTIEIPGNNVRLINAVQEIQSKQKSCVEYESNNYQNSKCISWREYEGYPYSYSSLDRNGEVLSNSVKYTFVLENEVSSQGSTAIILYYKADGYVKQDWGVFNFNFETIKWNADTQTIRVAVNVQENLYLKGGESSISYQPNFGVMEATASKMVQSDAMQQFSNEITYQSGYVKQAYGLDPWESFHVNGKYAKGWFSLYKTYVLIGLGILAAIIYGLYFFWGRFSFSCKKLSVVPISLGASFAFSLVFAGLFKLFEPLIRGIGYQMQEIVALMYVLVAAMVLITILVGPTVYVWKRHGALAGIVNFALTIGWLFLIVVFIALFFKSALTPTYLM